jgi:hypothetical protein
VEWTGLPGNFTGLLSGGFNDLHAVAFHCASWRPCRNFFVTKLHTLVTLSGNKPFTYSRPLGVAQNLQGVI